MRHSKISGSLTEDCGLCPGNAKQATSFALLVCPQLQQLSLQKSLKRKPCASFNVHFINPHRYTEGASTKSVAQTDHRSKQSAFSQLNCLLNLSSTLLIVPIKRCRVLEINWDSLGFGVAHTGKVAFICHPDTSVWCFFMYNESFW